MGQPNYYTSASVAGGYRGRIYTYDESGQREIDVWVSDKVFDHRGDAVDAAVDYAEENKLDVEIE
jgi:hypothetical protein